MKDPDMPDAGFTPTKFERQLLDSARADAIPPALKQSMQRALDASLATGAAGAAVGASVWASKTVVVVLVSAAALGSFAGYRWLNQPAQRASAPARVPLEVPSPAAPQVEPVVRAPQPPAAEPAQLREEIALLDRARAALQARTPERALGLLAQHAERFTQPSLGPEAEVLKIEALVQNRELPKARGLARKFVSEHPSSPLADRVARLAR